MFFGMCNSPATFQAMMDSIFSDMIEGWKVIVYMDNILIFAENQEELQEQMKQVLQRLREHDLFLKPKRCEFNKTTMEYTRLIIQEGKLSMDPVKLETGLPQLWLNKSEDSLDSQTSIDDSSRSLAN
jgi:Reverse transcriptase (RNA-dependent DNA polymerase)